MRILRTTERYEAGWREQNFIPDNEAAGLKSLDIPSLLGIVGLVWHQFDTTYEQNGFTESKELSVWDSSFFRILFMKKFQAKALLSLIKR